MPSKWLCLLAESYDELKQQVYSIYLRRVLLHLGSRTRIAPPVRLKNPEKIWIGNDVEIRFGCGLYGHSKYDIGIKIGLGCRIKEHCILDAYSGYIHLGQQVLLGQGSTIHGHGGVKIGDHTLLGAHVCILSNNHIYREIPKLIQLQGEKWEETIIGQNVWIGAGSTVLAGVIIGDNSVIGAGSVVTHNIPPGSIAVGVPAKVNKS